MTTTPIDSLETKVGVFLGLHHIVLYLLLAAGALGLVYAVESKLASLSDAKAEAAQQALAIEKDHEAQLAAAYAASQAERDKQNAQFLETISQLQYQIKIRIVHDRALPAPELGKRIETITGFKEGTITVDQSQDLIVPLPVGREIAAKLDQGEADAKTVVQQAGIIKNQATQIEDETAIIANDKKVLAAQITSDTDVLNAEKAKSRKSKLKWFFTGVVVGFIGRGVKF